MQGNEKVANEEMLAKTRAEIIILVRSLKKGM